MVNAEVTPGGELSFEGQIAGRIQGFRYTPDANIRAELAAIDDAEMTGAIAREFEVRANRLSEAVDSSLVLANDGAIRWLGEPIAKIAVGESLLAPRALILADETLTGAAQEKAQSRIELWLAAYIKRLLGPLFELESGVGLEGAARNVALLLVENLGVLERGRVAQDVKALDQNARGMLRKLGVRFGAYYIYIPSLVKPAIRVLATQLWALRQGGSADRADLHEIPQLAASGRTSFLADQTIPKETYRVAGFRLCGERAVRVDIVERLADLIRPAVAYRSGVSAGEPPAGSADGDGFTVTGAMTSLTGCSGEQFASVLRSLGFVSHLVKGPALTPVEKPRDVVANVPDDAPAEAAAPPVEDAEHGADAALVVITESGEADASSPIEERPAAEEPPHPSVVVVASEDCSEVAVATTPEVSSSDEDSGQAQGAVQVVEQAQAEEALIEVWRPRPPNRQRGPRGGAARDRIASQAASGRPQSAHHNEPRDEVGQRRRRPSPRPPPPSRVEAESAPKPTPDKFRASSGARRRFGASKEAQGADGGQSGRASGNPEDGRRHRERRQESVSAPAPRREAPINLDSPFAKLLALKLQLETKGKTE